MGSAIARQRSTVRLRIDGGRVIAHNSRPQDLALRSTDYPSNRQKARCSVSLQNEIFQLTFGQARVLLF
jgi:hypothetical protein